MAFKAKDGKKFGNRQKMKAYDEREPKKEAKEEKKEPEMEAKESPEHEAAEGGGMTCPHCGAEIEVGHVAKPKHESAPAMEHSAPPMGAMGGIPGM